jgi:hypothetical protein
MLLLLLAKNAVNVAREFLLKVRIFFFCINLGPVCFSSGSTSAFKAYCAKVGIKIDFNKF